MSRCGRLLCQIVLSTLLLYDVGIPVAQSNVPAAAIEPFQNGMQHLKEKAYADAIQAQSKTAYS